MKVLGHNIIIWQLLTILQYVIATRNFRVITNSVVCHSNNSEYVANTSCSVEERSEKYFINGFINFHKPINNFTFRWILTVVQENRPPMTLFDLKVDGCTVLKEAHSNKFLKITMKGLRKYINAPLVCPLKANFTYIVKDLIFDENDLPIYTPDARYRLTIIGLQLEKTSFKLVSNGQVINKVIKKKISLS